MIWKGFTVILIVFDDLYQEGSISIQQLMTKDISCLLLFRIKSACRISTNVHTEKGDLIHSLLLPEISSLPLEGHTWGNLLIRASYMFGHHVGHHGVLSTIVASKRALLWCFYKHGGIAPAPHSTSGTTFLGSRQMSACEPWHNSRMCGV